MVKILWGLLGHIIHSCTKFDEDWLGRFGEIMSTEIQTDTNIATQSIILPWWQNMVKVGETNVNNFFVSYWVHRTEKNMV